MIDNNTVQARIGDDVLDGTDATADVRAGGNLVAFHLGSKQKE